MKNVKSILVVLLALSVVCFACSAVVFAVPSANDQNEVSYLNVHIEYQNGVKKIDIQRNLKTAKTKLSSEDNIYICELEKHGAQSAKIQVEAFAFDEETNALQHMDMQANANDANTIWYASDGDVYIVTAAYLLGYDNHNQPIYKAYGEVHATRNFYFHNEDCFALKHGYNAVFNSNGVNMTGTLSYHAKEYKSIPYAPGGLTEEDRSFALTPSFSIDLVGVLYHFTWPADYDNSGTGGGYTVISRGNYTNRVVKGQFSLIATGTTAIQAYYIYNKNLFGGSLSVNLGPVAVGISVSGSNQTYAAQPLTIN